MSHIHLYMNNPTAGAIDGTEISAGDETLPLTLTLDASNAESAAAKCAVRCDSGYSLSGGASIYADGSNSNTWTFAADNDYNSATDALIFGTFQDTLIVADVAATNKIFWAKATSTTQTNPANDRTVDIVAEGHTVEVEVV